MKMKKTTKATVKKNKGGKKATVKMSKKTKRGY